MRHFIFKNIWIFPSSILVLGLKRPKNNNQHSGNEHTLCLGCHFKIRLPSKRNWASQVARWKEFTCQCRRRGFNLCAGKIPWRRKWQSTPALLPGKSHGRRSLIGYSPWGRKESTLLSDFTSLHFRHTSDIL